MRSTAGWFIGGAILVLAGVVLGVLITADINWSPVSNALEPVTLDTSVAASAIVGESPFVAVVDQVLPAVVSVDTKRTVRQSSDPFRDQIREFFGDRMFREYFGDEDQYREFEVPGSASGFIFDERGYILTNNHVVQGADQIDVTLMDGREFEAEIVGQDPNTDIAVIRIDGGDLPIVRLGDSDAVRVGGWAIAVGNPLELRGTVTVGVISAMGRVDLQIRGGAPLYQDFIQTDASINYGNSGGPLVNISGDVIGVNAAINPAAEGIGFAIPINLARNVAEALIAEGKVTRGYLGVVPQAITRELAEAKDLASTDGVIIASIEGGTPADDAGLIAGDVVVEFDGNRIEDVPQFRRVVASIAPGREVDIEIFRDGKRRTLQTTLVDRPESVATAEEEPESQTEWFGIIAADLDDPAIEDFEIEAEEGVLVLAVKRGSPAAEGGLLPGDVIAKVGDTEIANMEDYRDAMKHHEDQGKAILFMVYRGQYSYFVAVKPEK